MPTQEELEAAVAQARAEAEAQAEARIKAAANGKFTQEDLDRIAGDARKDGRTVAERELLKALGVDSVEGAKAAISAAEAAENEKKTELQRAQEEAATARQEAEAAKVEATSARIEAALSVALRDNGINPKRATAAMKLVDRSKLAVEGSDVSGLDAVVKELRDTSPEWFGTAVSPPNASDASGTGAPDFRSASDADFAKELARYGQKL